MLTYLKMLLSDKRTFVSALDVGLQHLGWTRKRSRRDRALDEHPSAQSPSSSGVRT
jgi:hypothetical protein